MSYLFEKSATQRLNLPKDSTEVRKFRDPSTRDAGLENREDGINLDSEYHHGLMMEQEKINTNNSSPNIFAANFNTNHNKNHIKLNDIKDFLRLFRINLVKLY